MNRNWGIALGVLLAATSGAASADSGMADSGDWTGPYVGLHVGGVRADFNNAFPPNPGPTDEAGSPIGGALAGYSLQTGRMVIGGEIDVSAMDIEAESGGGRFDEEFMLTLRGRVGYSFGRYLPFVTAGLALTEKETQVFGFGKDDRLEPGVTAGGGLERKITGFLALRGEYLYVNVPDDTMTLSGLPTVGGSDNHIFRGALILSF